MLRPLLAALALSSFADLGPKPTETFEFPPTVALGGAGGLLQCEKPDCSDGKPLQDYGPQHFACGGRSCSTMAYGFSPSPAPTFCSAPWPGRSG